MRISHSCFNTLCFLWSHYDINIVELCPDDIIEGITNRLSAASSGLHEREEGRGLLTLFLWQLTVLTYTEYLDTGVLTCLHTDAAPVYVMMMSVERESRFN